MFHAHYELQPDYMIRIMRDQIMDLQDMLNRASDKKGITLIRYMKKNIPAGRKTTGTKKGGL
jgi:hypothetical protein